MTENVLFIDMDGVINNNLEKVTKEAIMTLRYIINKYKCRVVLITSNIGRGTEVKKEMLKEYFYGLRIYNIDFIDTNFLGIHNNINLKFSTLGIIDYLKKHPNINYLIIDDENEEQYQMFDFNYLKTGMYDGLKFEQREDVKFESVNLENISDVSYQHRDLGKWYEVIQTENGRRLIRAVRE